MFLELVSGANEMWYSIMEYGTFPVVQFELYLK